MAISTKSEIFSVHAPIYSGRKHCNDMIHLCTVNLMYKIIINFEFNCEKEKKKKTIFLSYNYIKFINLVS